MEDVVKTVNTSTVPVKAEVHPDLTFNIPTNISDNLYAAETNRDPAENIKELLTLKSFDYYSYSHSSEQAAAAIKAVGCVFPIHYQIKFDNGTLHLNITNKRFYTEANHEPVIVKNQDLCKPFFRTWKPLKQFPKRKPFQKRRVYPIFQP
jgi:hypothetical protein